MSKSRYPGYSSNSNYYDYDDYDDRYSSSYSLNSLYKKYSFNTSTNIVRPIINYHDRSMLLDFATEYFFRDLKTQSPAFVLNAVLSGEGELLDKDQFIDLFNCYYRKNKIIDSESRPASYKKLTELYIDNLSIVTNNSVMCSLVISCEIALSLYNSEPVSETKLSSTLSTTYDEEMMARSQLGIDNDDRDYSDEDESGNNASNSLSKAISEAISIKNVRSFSIAMLNNTDFFYNLSDRLYSSVRNTFAESDEMQDVELLESEIIAEIAPDDIPIFLLPDCVKKALIADVHTIQPVGNNTFDIYIDMSGSMSNKVNKTTTVLDVAKGVTSILKQKNIVNDIYCFNTRLVGPLSFRDLIKVRTTGGTEFSPIMSNVEKVKRSSLVITDGEPDERDIPYDPLVSWIGVNCSMKFFEASVDSTRQAPQYTLNKKVFLYTAGETELRLKGAS